MCLSVWIWEWVFEKGAELLNLSLGLGSGWKWSHWQEEPLVQNSCHFSSQHLLPPFSHALLTGPPRPHWEETRRQRDSSQEHHDLGVYPLLISPLIERWIWICAAWGKSWSLQKKPQPLFRGLMSTLALQLMRRLSERKAKSRRLENIGRCF